MPENNKELLVAMTEIIAANGHVSLFVKGTHIVDLYVTDARHLIAINR